MGSRGSKRRETRHLERDGIQDPEGLMAMFAVNGKGNHVYGTKDGDETNKGDAVHGSKAQENEMQHDANGAVIVEIGAKLRI